MEALLSLYRRTVAADIEDTLQPANAHTLQRMLYESSDVFGHLSKYDNFHQAFGVPPNPCESVCFIRFWRGVEDVVTAPEPVITGSRRLDLQKALFADDALLRSVRHFRDELLKQTSPMSLSAFLSVIDCCSKSSDLTEFWSRVRENSHRTFSEGDIEVANVSDMIFGHLCQRFSYRSQGIGDLRTISTCTAFESDEDSEPVHSSRSFMSSIASCRSTASSEERYRQLLENLDVCLPEIYNRFCERIDELTTQRQQLEAECESREKQLDELRSEFDQGRLELQSRCDHLVESNSMLQRQTESQELELDSYRIQVMNLKRRLDSCDSARLEDEIQTVRSQCANLEKMNVDLRRSLDEAEARCAPTPSDHRDRTDVCVGDDTEYIGPTTLNVSPEDAWHASEERATMLKELQQYRTENAELSKAFEDMVKREKDLSRDLAAALLDNEATAERLKCYVPADSHAAEQQALQSKILSLETEVSSLRELVESLRSEGEIAESERSELLRAKSDLERDIAASRKATEVAETALKLLRQKCSQLEADAAATRDLERQLYEYRSCNSELQAKIDELTNENLVLASRIEDLNAPSTRLSGMTGAIENQAEDACFSLTPRTDTSVGEEPEERKLEVPYTGKIGINPALAETRRLNTMNAMKYGQLSADDANMPLSSVLGKEDYGPLVYRRTFGFQRSMTVLSDDKGIALLRDPRDLGANDSDVTPLSDTETFDVLQSAASYLSETFNFGLKSARKV
ncbi:viral A-type inclusion protein, putative [Babesia ovata]|uniref:Viral A-type inclusion protein, putative n=1 Tax=Babesia ovata TaxID=189622 RepID=A0A2H6KGR4_9APIC|nr:viral A-type inclusion protein, putative [Babesia ovata]GBE62159.1 viral A-type inclusion protein, putative [Babesia ovata]